jgi:drug/metabolite transporter (DMT)-like permease
VSERAELQSSLTVTYALMLVGVLIWGGNWVAAKIAVGAVPPLTLATLRYAVAVPVLLLWLRLQGPLPRIERRDWGPLALLGVLFCVVSNLLFLYGLQFAPSVDGAIIYPGFQPLLAGLMAAFILGEALARRQVVGFVVALVGLVLVVGGGQASAGGGSARILGDMMFFVGACVWAYTNILVRQLTRFSALAATTYSAMLILPLLVALSLWEGGWVTVRSALPTIWPALAYMALISTGPPTIFFYSGIRRLGVARAAGVTYLVPVSGVVFTTLLLGERLAPLQVAGGLLVLGGLWLVSAQRGGMGMVSAIRRRVA